MKILLNALDIRYIDLLLLEKYYIKTHNTHYLYSDTGVYIMVSDKFYKLNIQDVQSSSVIMENESKLSNIQLILDETYIEKERQLSQLPYNHIKVKESVNKYQLHAKSLVSLNILKYNDILHDIYFETHEEITNHSVKEDIITFLSILN
jgi:hypothetical protein